MSSLIKTRTTILLACLTLSLAACGFSPVYQAKTPSISSAQPSTGNVQKSLSNIEITRIPNAMGVMLRNELIDSFYRDGYPSQALYRLDISKISEKTNDFDITIESEATRRQLTLKTQMMLFPKNNTRTDALLTRTLKIVTSYDVIGSQFKTRVAEEDARRAAIRDLARQIELQLALYLKRT